MIEWMCADEVFDGASLLPNHAVGIENGRVTSLKATSDLAAEAHKTHVKGLLTPGFFDIQVNGGGGALLNTAPSPDGIKTIAKAHRSLGTVDLLPTVISDAPEVLDAAAHSILQTRDVPGVRGLHIEGPHLSKARRGTHDAQHLRKLDARTFGVVRMLRDASLPVLITVAPEAATPSQIGELKDMGAVVSIGHSDTTAETVSECVAAGATCFTHLFNAMSPMLNRAPGVTGAAIASDAWCSIIADGIHVDPTMVALAIRARPRPDRMIAISDAMPTVGGPDRFDLYGTKIQLSDGRLINQEGSLAGAHVTVCDAIGNLVQYGIPKEQALRMGRHNPAQLMGLWPNMQLVGTNTDDLIVLSDDLKLQSVGLSDAKISA